MQTNSKGVSVVICCYNSSSRLPKTLEYLSNQIVEGALKWEIIVVDNSSTDETASIAIQEWSKYDSNVPLRVVKESTPGLTHARKKGVLESQYEYVIFCDDDNWLCPTYLSETYNILINDPTIGALGGWGEPVYDEQPEKWFIEGNFFSRMATGPQGHESGDVTQSKGYVYGAGMAAPRKLLIQIFEHEKHYLKDRTGKLLTGGGDVEICYLMRLLGYKIWYSEKLKFQHFMPGSRMTENYLLQLSKGKAYSTVLLLPYELVFNNDPRLHKKLIWLRIIYVRLKSYFKSLSSKPAETELQRIKQQMGRNSVLGSIKSLWIHNFSIDNRVQIIKDRVLLKSK